MSIAKTQMEFEYKAILSISEFSAIDGGIASYMLANLGPFTWAIVTMHFGAQIYCNDNFNWDIADIFEIIGVVGLIMIGIFELDPYNPPMQRFHNVGAIAGVGTIAGYMIQGFSLMKSTGNVGYAIVPIIIAIIAAISLFIWRCVIRKRTNNFQQLIVDNYANNEISEEKDAEIRNQITKLSLQNVFWESISLFCGATSLAIYLMNYEKDCCYGCVGSQNITCTYRIR